MTSKIISLSYRYQYLLVCFKKNKKLLEHINISRWSANLFKDEGLIFLDFKSVFLPWDIKRTSKEQQQSAVVIKGYFSLLHPHPKEHYD